MVLDKAGILAGLKLKTEEIELAGGTVRIQGLTALDYSKLQDTFSTSQGDAEWDGVKFVALLATRCIVDEEGKRIFEDDDAALLLGGSKADYNKLAVAVQRVNGIGAEAKN